MPDWLKTIGCQVWITYGRFELSITLMWGITDSEYISNDRQPGTMIFASIDLKCGIGWHYYLSGMYKSCIDMH